jgi:hypothetical protein
MAEHRGAPWRARQHRQIPHPARRAAHRPGSELDQRSRRSTSRDPGNTPDRVGRTVHHGSCSAGPLLERWRLDPEPPSLVRHAQEAVRWLSTSIACLDEDSRAPDDDASQHRLLRGASARKPSGPPLRLLARLWQESCEKMRPIRLPGDTIARVDHNIWRVLHSGDVGEGLVD